MEEGKNLGTVVSGSLTKGLEVRLDATTSVEDIAIGSYVTIEGKEHRFFGMITDISLEATDSEIANSPPDISNPFIAEVIAGTATYGELHVLPMLTIGGAKEILEGPQPVKSLPAHFSKVKQSSPRDIELVFGQEDERQFWVGTPLDMETKICLNLNELVKRSNGIFGKSGTGKTFLTRLLLIGILQKRQAVSLVFDMHNEYGWEGGSEKGYKVKGLKQLFPSQVAIFSLDEEGSRRRRVSTDFVVRIGYDEIEPEDIQLLRQTLNLTDASIQAAYQLAQEFGDRHWLERTLGIKDKEDTKELISRLNIHESTYRNLRRGLETLRRLPFLVPQSPDNPVKRILEYLDRGINVILEFGRYADITAYILVANLLTRRMYDQYRERTEKAIGEDTALPRPLVITIEEAHRFLNPELSNQTIFGTIAREMRKYYVTLLIVDQRPSGIDSEVMSQLGTKIAYLLDNDEDINSVLSGTPGKSELKTVLSKLETRQQSLVFGHAVPMPVPIKVREYGADYKQFSPVTTIRSTEPGEGAVKQSQEAEDLWAD
jgi:DNA helicase HerA-like ATPase